MDKKVFSTTDLIEQIRDYQNKNSELLRSHHFVFDCPLGSNTQLKPEFIWMGINPGKDEEDWKKTKNKNDEETRDRNFQNLYQRSKNSKTRMTKIKNFLGFETFNKTTHTELFFWGSKDTNKHFESRYGTKLFTSPHLEFCSKMNNLLMDRVKPKVIFFESLDKINILKKFFNINKIKSYNVSSRVVDEYLLNKKYRLINFDHLSAGPPASLSRLEVSEFVRKLIN